MIIGVSGPIGAGKTTICEILKARGFRYISLSDVLREECIKRGLNLERKNLRRVGDELRKRYGKAALAIIAWKRIEKNGNWVIDSIRVPEEAEYFKKKGAFILGVYAPAKIRYERIRARGRDLYKSFEEFRREDEHDRALGIDQILKNADFIILNDGTMEELEENVDMLLNFISSSSQNS